ncbi:MAG: hypothetical protein WDN44_01080 [Sphingomonas sp.]
MGSTGFNLGHDAPPAGERLLRRRARAAAHDRHRQGPARSRADGGNGARPAEPPHPERARRHRLRPRARAEHDMRP